MILEKIRYDNRIPILCTHRNYIQMLKVVFFEWVQLQIVFIFFFVDFLYVKLL